MANVESFVDRFRRLAMVGMQSAVFAGALFAFATFFDRPHVVAISGTAMVASAASFVLASLGRTAASVTVLSILLVVLPYPLAWLAKGMYDVSMLLAPAGIVAIGLLETPRRTIAFALVTVAGATSVLIATTQGWTGYEFTEAWRQAAGREGPIALATIAFAAGVGVLVSVAFDRLVRALAQRSEALEAAVSARTRELQQANHDLREALATVEQSTRELVRSEKLAALGGVVAGVTHELNTPIGNALLAASSLGDSVAGLRAKYASGQLKRSEFDAFTDEAAHLGALVVRSLERANDIARSFKRVAVDQASERRREFRLDELVDDVVRTTLPGLGPRAPTVRVEIGADIAMDSFPGPLSQVVANLLQNAALHAYDDRPPGEVRLRSRPLDDDRIELVVEDDGCGIPAERHDAVFRPFFTTRAGRGGSGLGLSICRSLVVSHLGGSMDLESAEGRGARFLLRIPRVAPTA